jgi:hypothetical protein
MTKPAITSRATKGLALTYNELDTNFSNLRDATLSITAGSSGTAVTSDLNGNITLVAGTGITLTGDNTSKTITINSSSGGSVNSGADGALAFYSGTGTTIDDTLISYSGNASQVSLQVNGTSTNLTLSANGGISLTSGTEIEIYASGSNYTLSLSAGTYRDGSTTAPNGGIRAQAPLRFRNLTSTLRNNLTNNAKETGSMIYNTTTSTLDYWDGGAWRSVVYNNGGQITVFSAYGSTASSLSNNTWTKMTLNAEEYDNNNYFDTNSGSWQFTPQIAGYYFVRGHYAFTPTVSTGGAHIAIYKNGSEYKRGQRIPFNTTGVALEISCTVYLNGSTDYIQLYGQHNSGAGVTITTDTTTANATRLEGHWIGN